MIGDLLIWIRVIKLQLTCKHDYKHKVINAYPPFHYQECKRCGKWK